MAASRMRFGTALCALVGLVWLAPAASATGPDDLVVRPTPLEAVEEPPSVEVDELVEHATLDPDDLVEDTTSVDALDQPHTTSLDQVDTGQTYTEAEVKQAGHWEPTPCDLLRVPTPPLPLSSDVAGWGKMLHDAEERISVTRDNLDRTTALYTRIMNDNQGGMSDHPVVQQLDAARKDYEQALCTLPKLQEAARRTGLPPGLIHRSPPAARP